MAILALKHFASGEACIAGIASQPDLIILDYQLDGIDRAAMNGIDTLDKIKSALPGHPDSYAVFPG
jgi:two-component system OmpR family response regulator